MSHESAVRLWEEDFMEWGFHVREISDSLMRDALDVRRRYGCSLYDSFAPAIAEQLGATLYSADKRAHGSWPGVVLVGIG